MAKLLVSNDPNDPVRLVIQVVGCMMIDFPMRAACKFGHTKGLI